MWLWNRRARTSTNATQSTLCRDNVALGWEAIEMQGLYPSDTVERRCHESRK